MAYQRQQDSRHSARPGDVLMVVHDFEARSSDELTLRRGDRIALVELDDGFGDGWYLGKHLGSGTTGLFPGVYTTKVPAGLPNLRINGPILRPPVPSESYNYRAAPSLNPANDPRLPFFSVPRDTPPVPGQGFVPPKQSVETPSVETPNQPADNQVESPMILGPPSSIPGVQRSIKDALGPTRNGQDSPVMNQTLNEIDSHITDLSTPRHSLAMPDTTDIDDSDSEYSSHLDRRTSHALGVDDAGGKQKLTENEVRQWSSRQTADHLRSLGVDPTHCDIFEEQEITGDVLLEMDQAFIYMKEFDFGVMGRRLKTWHKIRGLQEEVRGSQPQQPFLQPDSTSSLPGTSSEDLSYGQEATGFLREEGGPRSSTQASSTRSFHKQHVRQNTDPNTYPLPLHTPSMGSNNTRTAASVTSPPSAWRASLGPDSPSRPSAALVREMSHSRRHSSMDAASAQPLDASGGSAGNAVPAHRKQSSLDRGWSMTSGTSKPSDPSGLASASVPALRLSTIRQEITDETSEHSSLAEPSAVDLDRGYFSGHESENRRSRHFLRKRDSAGSPANSRLSKIMDEQKQTSQAFRVHARIGSADSIRDMVPPVTSPASKTYHSNMFKSRWRSASARTPDRALSGGFSPTVTNLEEESSPSLVASPIMGVQAPTFSTTRARKLLGLRSISDAVTGHEKGWMVSPANIPPPVKEVELSSPARTGSSTPSVASKELDTSEVSSKVTDGSLAMAQLRPILRPKMKSKKDTSAYTRGLQKKTPAEQRIGSDYSGWMKKKSSNLVTTWKPRLFVLRGRRLSYYYSEDDVEERGVIDISSHKVLVANKDAIMTLHATITGAATSSSGPLSSSDLSAKASHDSGSTNTRPSLGGNSPHTSPFYFKLVPPKAGLSRAVQFTKPTVHYFQVDSIAEGRKWMGEMMKATIEHTATNFETTNKQKTITLAKARARKERPPALMGDHGLGAPGDEADEEEDAATAAAAAPEERNGGSTGLNIQGLNFDETAERVDRDSAGREMPPPPAPSVHQKSSSLDTMPQ